MFKKLKDKLAEEVKSSPQRIQQFAQAAQAAVTSASSSISDITNSDLFSIGDNDNPQNNQARPQTSPNKPQNMFQDVNLLQSPSDSLDYTQEMDSQRQRRLSNSSFASDVSFRLPSYETPSMYHLQSDMEVSASEADERGFSGGPATLDRVTKEQLYAAYKRTQERYTKYRTQYGDLARHYKLLERENAKARSVLVETQDKALRRISELKEQCALEQSAKAHLEKAMRVEIEEKNMKIETLNTKIQLLQSDNIPHENEDKTNSNEKQASDKENEVQLINLSNDSQVEDPATELTTLNNKIEKMEMLLNKYKESLKTTKEKNSQISAELQKVTHELECKSKEIEDLKVVEEHLNEAKNQIKQLNDEKEDLENQINTFDFNKTRELSTLEIDLQKANEEIADLQKKIDVFHKREEEYAISLAENKLSIHKELESKETEIKSLKDMLDASKKEIMSLNIVISDYKNNVSSLEEEKTKLNNNCAELNSIRTKFNEAESQLQDLSKKCQSLEQIKTKADEEYKCLQLQLKQETAEKLAMIDRNTYLESRNTQLTDDISKKNSQISQIESELKKHLNSKNQQNDEEKSVKDQLVHEATMWKEKCCKLESEIQEERVELVKLQEEIEKLLANHQLLQAQNAEFRVTMANLTSENVSLNEEVNKIKTITANMVKVTKELRSLKSLLTETSNTTRSFISTNNECFDSFTKDITTYVTNYIQHSERKITTLSAKYNKLTKDYKNLENELDTNNSKNLEILRESDKIREENIKLTEENQSMDKKLNDISTLHETNVAELNDLKHEKVTLMENLKAVESTCQETELALTNEKNQHSKTLELVKTMELEKKLALTNEKDQHSETSQLVKTIELEKQELQNKLQVIDNENEILKKQYDALNKNYEKVNSEINDLKSEITMKSNEIEKYKLINDENALIKNQYDALNEKYEKVNSEINDLKSEITMKSNEVEKYKSINDENALLKNEYDVLNEKYEKVNSEINDLKSEISIKSNEVEKYKSIQESLEKEIAQYALNGERLSSLEQDKQAFEFKVNELNDKNNKLVAELKDLSDLQKVSEETITRLSKNIENKSNEIGDKLLQISELEDSIQSLTQENIRLKTDTSNFVSNINQLESEIDDIKKSHAEIEGEKDRLNNIIENLEKQSQKEYNSIDIQTDENSREDVQIPENAPTMFENKWVLENKQSLMSNTASLNMMTNAQEDAFEKYNSLQTKYDSLKDENKRLQSDIEGLQSYLTKISKENSILNDKLREVIASSEHSVDDNTSADIIEIRNEVKLNKEKINDLLRENSLLIEENLELKDQLQSQNYSKTKEVLNSRHNNTEIEVGSEKYDNLMEVNNQLQKRNMDLEQINKSVNGNMSQLQEKNERLKLSNEKLERRLDEALVSLRHLHSLQENTELEYLRNILYEYLTGSGTHSVTLAKVLSAIVKFDDSQTQQVLQKEKERQGFLRQLGLI